MWFAALAVAPLCHAQEAQPKAAPLMPEERFVHIAAIVRPSIVAIASYHNKDTPTIIYYGTGFVIGDGRTVITNQHVVEPIRKRDRLGQLRVIFADDNRPAGWSARLVAEDRVHDLAVLRFEGPPAPALDLAPMAAAEAPQGRSIGIMGYPLGLVLGRAPSVHRGVIAASVRAVQPLPKGAKLTPELARAIREKFRLYQLDIVALPGNSGSPLFDARTGVVLGVVNKVYGSRTREHLIAHPTGITYAVPVKWVHELVKQASSTDARARDDRTRLQNVR